jgi:hypothetical protein
MHTLNNGELHGKCSSDEKQWKLFMPNAQALSSMGVSVDVSEVEHSVYSVSYRCQGFGHLLTMARRGKCAEVFVLDP